MPLGIYLLSFYGLKHRLRASLFERFDVPLPEPWRKIRSILPSWPGTGDTFRSADTGEITVHDPRRRDFPWRADRDAALIRTHKYLAAYNARQGACTTFWGHSGRSIRANVRFRPTIYRVGFVFLAACIMWRGSLSVFYEVPSVELERLKHPKSIKPEDVARLFRLLRYWQTFSFSRCYTSPCITTLVLAYMRSMLVLFLRTVWKYVPQEEKDNIMRKVREQEQLRRAGRVRLE
jgi:hypothetical protein